MSVTQGLFQNLFASGILKFGNRTFLGNSVSPKSPGIGFLGIRYSRSGLLNYISGLQVKFLKAIYI